MRSQPRFTKPVTTAVLSVGALISFLVPPVSAQRHHAPVHRHHRLVHHAKRLRRAHRYLQRHHGVHRRAVESAVRARILHLAAEVPAGGVWARLRVCESAGNYRENSGNGYYGAYQFSLTTWHSIGGQGRPDAASVAVQDALAARLQARSGWGSWPACSWSLGL